jgi:hypothetical protein
MTACGGPRRGRRKASPLAAYTAGPRPAAAAGRAAGDGEAAAGEEDLALRQPRNAWGAHDLGQHAPERRERRYRDVSVLWAQSRRERGCVCGDDLRSGGRPTAAMLTVRRQDDRCQTRVAYEMKSLLKFAKKAPRELGVCKSLQYARNHNLMLTTTKRSC